MNQSQSNLSQHRVVYCNCTYAKVVPQETKQKVLSELTSSGVAFDAFADLCQMSARKDPVLKELAESDDLKIVACFPRAVKWLFHAADAALDDDRHEILNMREQDADEIVPLLLEGQPISGGPSHED